MTQYLSIVADFFSELQKKPLITIIGPTASGKTAFSIQFVKQLASEGITAEIVNADSRQFYKYLDIGTAKISENEMAGVPHHLMSILDPKEDCTISWFQKEASKVIDDIQNRGHLPILVGGSMLYVSAIVDGLLPIASSPEIRDRLEKEYDIDSGETLYKKLQEIDPDSAASFSKENKVYVVRALEIYESTGMTKSAQKKAVKSPYNVCILGIDLPKEVLRQKIDDRTRVMLESGWIEEVQSLLEKGYSIDDPGMKSLGYREIAEWLNSPHPQPLPRHGGGEIRFANREGAKKLTEKISSKVRAYAKRHQTWWKRDKRVQWLTPPVV